MSNRKTRLLKEIAALLIRFCGLPFLVKTFLSRNKATIIQYHDPAPEVLEKHLSYLLKRYNVITLDTLVDAIHSKNWGRIPAKSLVITFDDGHKSNFTLFRLFRKYGITPTIYVCSGVVAQKRHFWFKTADIRPENFKRLPNAQRLMILNERSGFSPSREYPDRQALSRAEIELMKDAVDFQSHSRFHPILTTCNEEECRDEIAGSRRDIEHLVARSCRHFAFPNGDYTERELRIVKEAGYLSARTVDAGWNGRDADPYRLKIIGISDHASINFLIAQLTGVTMFLRYLSKGSFSGRHKTVIIGAKNRPTLQGKPALTE